MSIPGYLEHGEISRGFLEVTFKLRLDEKEGLYQVDKIEDNEGPGVIIKTSYSR